MDTETKKENEVSQEEKKERINIDTTKSSHKGFMGFFESTLRRFRMVTSLGLIMFLCLLVCVLIGLCLLPSVYLVMYAHKVSVGWEQLYRYGLIAFSISCAYFAYGYTLLFMAPLFNFLIPFRLKPWRGIYYSLSTIPWYFHNAFTYVMRYTFLFLLLQLLLIHFSIK